jgi:hypothetical protein
MQEKIIPNVPRVAQFIGSQSYLTPFVGSLWAALHGMGMIRPYHDLLALSGAGNRLSWRPGVWNGGNVDILACEEPPTAPHLRVLAALGLTAKVRLCKEIAGLPGPYAAEEEARAEIVASIDQGIPVIAMGIIGPPECCVVHGYQEDGQILIGWNYFQGDEGFDPEQPFKKKSWFAGLAGYLLLEHGDAAPSEKENALATFRAITSHASQGMVRGAYVGFAAWIAMLHQLEHDDFSACTLLLPGPGEGIWEEDVWNTTLQGRFFVYCDALCQIHERGVALPWYQRMADDHPEWQKYLIPAIAAWKECSSYGGFLWKYVTMDPAGYEKFRDPAIRKILADEGLRSFEKDKEAIGYIEELLKRETA